METFVNDTIRFSVDAGIDLSGYADLLVKYKKPDGATGCWPATICVADNECMYYDTQIGDLDQSGEWIVQAIARDVGVQLTGKWAKFTVYDPLAEYCTTAPPTTVVPTTAGP